MNLVALSWTGSGMPKRRLIACADGRIKEAREVADSFTADNAVVYPKSAIVVPGLHDAHLHLLEGGLWLDELSFRGVGSMEEAMTLLRDYVSRRSPEKGQWICGHLLSEGAVPLTRTDLDKIVPDHPVFIWTGDWHSAVVNSAALIAARIDGNVKDPERGRFERDSSGILNGVLRENAAYIVRKSIPEPNAEQAHAAFLKAQDLAFKNGFTTVSCSVRRDLWQHYLRFGESSERKVRLNFWRVTDTFDLEQDRFEKIETADFRMAAFKGFADGALGSQTAAMHAPYDNQPDNSGLALIRESVLARFVRASHKEAFQVAMHAIGDRANSICLDAFEMAGSAGLGPMLRPRIEHCQILRERDIKRFAELGVIASVQPIHQTADMRIVEPRIGSRAKFAYAWRSLIDAGATLAFGSDWPVEEMSPIAGIHAAVTRQNTDSEPDGGWYPEQRITVAEALRAYTFGSAYAANWEQNIGTIIPGKCADFTILDRNIFDGAPEEILETKILATIVNGEVVYAS